MNKIIIDPHYCSREEYQLLIDYLNIGSWDWREVSSGEESTPLSAKDFKIGDRVKSEGLPYVVETDSDLSDKDDWELPWEGEVTGVFPGRITGEIEVKHPVNGVFRMCAIQLYPLPIKSFNIRRNIGKARYVVNFHDGNKKHDDGSKFFDVHICHNKKELKIFVDSLKTNGYSEE